MSQYILQLTPEAEAKIEIEREQKLTSYRRDYWQQYKKNHKRVYGTMTLEEYAQVKARAEVHGFTVWEQIWQESQNYCNKSYLPDQNIRSQISKLYAELRRIGNNLNQIAKKTHIFAGKNAGQQAREQIAALEEEIAQFTMRPWGRS